MKVEVAVPNSPYSLCGRKATLNLNLFVFRTQELFKNRGGCPGLPVPSSPMVRVDKSNTELNRTVVVKAQEQCESRGGRSGLLVPNSPCGLCGLKATLNELSG